MKVIVELDINNKFGDDRGWVYDYLETVDEEYRQEAYEGLSFVKEKVDKLLAANSLFKDFCLSFDFEGDDGLTDQASLAYMKYIGDEGYLYFTEIGHNHYMLTGE